PTLGLTFIAARTLPSSPLFPYTTLFRSRRARRVRDGAPRPAAQLLVRGDDVHHQVPEGPAELDHRDGRDRVQRELLGRPGLHPGDRKSTRLNSSHRTISYAVFCLKKKKS